jgi:hypothetical protein
MPGEAVKVSLTPSEQMRSVTQRTVLRRSAMPVDFGCQNPTIASGNGKMKVNARSVIELQKSIPFRVKLLITPNPK